MLIKLQRPGQQKTGDAYVLARSADGEIREEWPMTPSIMWRMAEQSTIYVDAHKIERQTPWCIHGERSEHDWQAEVDRVERRRKNERQQG